MALIKYDHDSLTAALRPGIEALVIDTFKKRLEEKMNGIIEETFKSLLEELPQRISSNIKSAMEYHNSRELFHVEVDFTGYTLGNNNDET